jgi:high-affinity iron transporter
VDARGGVAVEVLTRRSVSAATGLPAQVTAEQLRRLNGGRLPLGVSAPESTRPVTLTYRQTVVDTLFVDPATSRLVDASRRTTVSATADLTSGPVVLENVRGTKQQPTETARAALLAADSHERFAASRARSWGTDYPTLLGVAASVFAALAAGAGLAQARRSRGIVDLSTSRAGPNASLPVRERAIAGLHNRY